MIYKEFYLKYFRRNIITNLKFELWGVQGGSKGITGGPSNPDYNIIKVPYDAADHSDSKIPSPDLGFFPDPQVSDMFAPPVS